MESSLDSIIELTFDLSRVIRHMMVNVSEHGAHVNFLQIHALALIEQHPGMTMKELADALRVASPSATSFVNRLEKLGWIMREHDAQNRRLVRLMLTNAGKSIMREKRALRTATLKKFLGFLTPEDQRQLVQILEKLHRASGASPS